MGKSNEISFIEHTIKQIDTAKENILNGNFITEELLYLLGMCKGLILQKKENNTQILK